MKKLFSVIVLILLLLMVSRGYCSENRWGQTDTYQLLGKVLPGYIQATGTALGGAASMATLDTAVPTGYAFVKKQIGAAVGQAGTLANGTKGQILKIFIVEVADSGTFILTPTTKTGFSTLTFNGENDEATLLYVDSIIGWILMHSISVTVGVPAEW